MEGRMDMKRLVFGFRNFANAPKITRSTYTVHLCVLCGSENKQRLFTYTALTDWFYSRDMACLLRGTDWILVSIWS
jgi:hypothetical protein